MTMAILALGEYLKLKNPQPASEESSNKNKTTSIKNT